MGLTRVGAILLTVAAILAAGVAPSAASVAPVVAPVPGATYTGTVTGGVQVTFQVSADATMVIAYAVTGTVPGGCEYYAAGGAAVWQGAPIVAGAFHYQLGDGVLFTGRFTGPQSAAGTFSFYQPASGLSASCSTGVLQWTAATTAPAITAHLAKRTATAAVDLEQASTTLTGQVQTSSQGCRKDRTVILWSGLDEIASGQTTTSGQFSFGNTALWSGHNVRVSVTPRIVRTVKVRIVRRRKGRRTRRRKVRTVREITCEAGSSIFIPTTM